MKKKTLIVAGIVTAVIIGMAAAGMAYWPHGPEERIDWLKSRIADRLDLSDAQKLTLDGLAEEILAEQTRRFAEREAFKDRFLETMQQESVNPDELKQLFETQKPVIESVMQMAASHIAEFHAMLTPAQRQILVEEIASHHERRCRWID